MVSPLWTRGRAGEMVPDHHGARWPWVNPEAGSVPLRVALRSAEITEFLKEFLNFTYI